MGWSSAVGATAMRRVLRITDRNRTAEEVPIFAGKGSGAGVYVVVKTQEGLVALDRAYEPMGLIVDSDGTLWEELDQHPGKRMKEFHREFPVAGITGDAIWLDLDP
jgi:hypothetical protein